ncbi:MAG: hypothetical protein Q9181_002626 [Wetmoreana brouardii]
MESVPYRRLNIESRSCVASLIQGDVKTKGTKCMTLPSESRDTSRLAAAVSCDDVGIVPIPYLTRHLITQQQKDSQSKDSLAPEATEYSKSGTDDASARHEDTAFDPDTTDPGQQKDKVEDSTGASDNPLEVSPANHEISQPNSNTEGGAENSSASSGTTSDRERASGGGSPKKGSNVA